MLRKNYLKKICFFSLVLSFISVNAQVGIGTSDPEGVLDIVSEDSALILPRNEDPDGDDDVVGDDNDGIANPVEGMLVYDKSTKMIEFFDGEKWQAMNYIGNPTTTNEGVVKINSGGASEDQPYFSIQTGGNAEFQTNEYYQVTYDSPLHFSDSPVTSWPEGTDSGEDSIYDSSDGTFYENAVEGQVHLWRVVVEYEQTGTGSDTYVVVQLKNPVSGFVLEDSSPAVSTTGTLTYLFLTVADESSLTNGYEFFVKANGKVNITFDSITRVSLLKD